MYGEVWQVSTLTNWWGSSATQQERCEPCRKIVQCALHWWWMWVVMMMAMQVKCGLHAQVYQHGISVILNYIWVNKCHITMVILLYYGQLSSCECVHRCLCRYLRKYLHSSPQASAVSGYIKEWRQPEDTSQGRIISVDKGTDGVTWCLVWVTWWWTAPSRKRTEPDRLSHFVFLLREVVLRPHIGFPLVGGGLSKHQDSSVVEAQSLLWHWFQRGTWFSKVIEGTCGYPVLVNWH